MVAEPRHRLRARASAQRRAVLARQWRRAIPATLELRVTAELEIRLRGIAGLRLRLHFLEIQERLLAGLVRM